MMKTKSLIKNFTVGQTVVCTQGINKGTAFVIIAILESKNKYSLQIADGSNDKYYGYDDAWLELAK